MRYKGSVNTMYQAEVGGDRDQTAVATNEATSSSGQTEVTAECHSCRTARDQMERMCRNKF